MSERPPGWVPVHGLVRLGFNTIWGLVFPRPGSLELPDSVTGMQTALYKHQGSLTSEAPRVCYTENPVAQLFVQGTKILS